MGTATRRCLGCSYTGEMKSWLGNYILPQLIMLVLLLLYIIPGIIFIAWAHGKFKCPNCGVLRNTTDIASGVPVQLQDSQSAARVERACPWCAEQILVQAKICKHCRRDVSAA